ncbi:hypothetical protein [Hymenobacter sp. B81]|uniref:hypothetical protein n=1 Tax=Hymenobacter sp. B81 TaxID=3344878 RepID=UPI0037DC3098
MLQRLAQALFPARFAAADDRSFGLFGQRGLPELLRRRRWREVEQVLLAAQPDELSLLLDELCLTDRYTLHLRAYLQATDSELGRLVQGVYDTHRAWEARTSNWAAEVTEAQADGFVHYLLAAHRSLSAEYAAPGLQLEALARRIRVEMGLNELPEAHKTFAAAVSLHPDHVLTYLNYFKALSPRWLGSRDELLELITFAENPDTRQLLRLVFLVEMFSDLQQEDELTAATELRRQHAATLEEALQSPLPPLSSTMKSIYAHNYWACLCSILNRDEPRRAALRQLGTRFTPYPWAYFGAKTPAQIRALQLG